MWKKPSVLLGGAAVYVGATTAAYLTFYEPKKDENAEAMTNTKRLQVFNGNAGEYDKGADATDRLAMAAFSPTHVALEQT